MWTRTGEKITDGRLIIGWRDLTFMFAISIDHQKGEVQIEGGRTGAIDTLAVSGRTSLLRSSRDLERLLHGDDLELFDDLEQNGDSSAVITSRSFLF